MLSECHCGKDGHALSSVNCPVHGYKIVRQPEYEALNKFDAENNVEPPRIVARRIAMKWDINQRHPIVDDIAIAIEDAMRLGGRRGKYLP